MTEDIRAHAQCDAGQSLDAIWQELLDKDDRTSPEEYPDMALITRDELQDFLMRWAERERDRAVVRGRAVTRAAQAGRCICQDQHRRGYCTEPGCPYASPVTPAEGERQRCMEILEDVPGETLVDRVNRLKDWHQELRNSYHDAIAEARTERDQSIALVEGLTARLHDILEADQVLSSVGVTSGTFRRHMADPLIAARELLDRSPEHSSTVGTPK